MTTSAKTISPHRIIRASAGTGKTFQLTNRLIQLLDEGVAPERILASTFTRKAAGEILERLISRLAQATADDARCAALARETERPTLTRERCRELLATLVRRLHRLQIGTLDSVFMRMARGFSLELGIPPAWTIAESQRDARLRREAVEGLLESRAQESEALSRLCQQLALGSTERSVRRLLQTTIDELYDLYLETSLLPNGEAAWKHFENLKPLTNEQVARIVDDIEVFPDEGVFANPRAADAARFREGNTKGFLTTGLAGKIAAGEEVFNRKEIPYDLARLYQQLIAHLGNLNLLKLAQQNEAAFDFLSQFHGEYTVRKHRARLLRFDDITRTLAAVADRFTPEQLAYRTDAACDHLLLDEFQDTSIAQWRVLRPLAQRVASPQAKGSLFCVGDTKQAIYGWRGGVAEIFDTLETDIADLHAEPLAKSWRSAQPIVDVVNRVFTRIGNHESLGRLAQGIETWRQRFVEHTTARGELAGYAALEVVPLEMYEAEKNNAIYKFAAQRVAELHRQAPHKQIAVLVRSNAAVSTMVYYLRKDHQLPVSDEGGNAPTDARGVQLILSLLRLADHPGDTVAQFHVLHSALAPQLGVTPKEHQTLPKSKGAAWALELRQELLSNGYGPALQRWTDLLQPYCDAREWSRLRQVVELAYAYQDEATLRPGDFAEFLAAQRLGDPTADPIRVLTVHQAKGLQFDTVVLPELHKPLLGRTQFVVDRPSPTEPVSRVCRYTDAAMQALLPDDLQRLFRQNDAWKTEESLCVLYVALTRAIHAMHLIVPPIKPRKGSGAASLGMTYAGLIRAALLDEPRKNEPNPVFEVGNRDWFAADEEKMPAQLIAPAASRIQTIPISLAPPSDARRDRERISPSQLEGGMLRPIRSLLPPAEAREALDYGTAIHACFELIEWLDDGLPSDDALRDHLAATFARLRQPAEEAKIGRWIREFHKYLESETISRRLTRDAYRTPSSAGFNANLADRLAAPDVTMHVENERRFAVRAGGQMLTGSIDRLITWRAGDKVLAAEIVDFKTDALSDAAAETAADALPLAETKAKKTVRRGKADKNSFAAKIEYYRPQMEAYRMAASQMLALPGEAITARLLFVGAKREYAIAPGKLVTINES